MSARPEKLRIQPVPQRAAPAEKRIPQPRKPALWRRTLPPSVFFGVPALLLLLLGALGYGMVMEARREAPQRFSPGQLAEFQQKKKSLADARALFTNGRYAKSAAAYDAYLNRYPYSTAAKDGRAAARAALQRSTTKTSAAPSARKPAPSAERDKPSLRNRMRRIFRSRDGS